MVYNTPQGGYIPRFIHPGRLYTQVYTPREAIIHLSGPLREAIIHLSGPLRETNTGLYPRRYTQGGIYALPALFVGSPVHPPCTPVGTVRPCSTVCTPFGLTDVHFWEASQGWLGQSREASQRGLFSPFLTVLRGFPLV